MKDEWNAFVKTNACQDVEWWVRHYQDQLAQRGGLTSREWDRYDRVKQQAGMPK